VSRRDLVDFVALPVEAGWYGVICLAGGGKTLKLAVYSMAPSGANIRCFLGFDRKSILRQSCKLKLG